MSLGAIGFIYESYAILLLLLFLMGTQSAFFGPVKYALLPQQLESKELVSGNALVETGTFLAILIGTLGAGIIASEENSKLIAAVCIVTFAVLGYLASYFIPEAPSNAPDLKVKWQPITLTRQTLAIAKKRSTYVPSTDGNKLVLVLRGDLSLNFPTSQGLPKRYRKCCRVSISTVFSRYCHWLISL